MAVNPEVLKPTGEESFKPEKRAVLYHGPVGGIIGALFFGVPGAMVGYLAAGSIGWWQGIDKETQPSLISAGD